ncbi:MAG: sensor histidine kinase [Lachnospiraceae bacterium]|nr:sensor histidine kinase [Lachnospiraceae bacterium]
MRIVEILLTCCFEVLLLQSFTGVLLSRREKYHGLRKLLAITLMTGALIAVNSCGSTLLNLIGVPVIYCIYTVAYSSETFLKCISCAVSFYMLAMVPEFVASVAFSMSDHQDVERILGNGLSAFCFILAVKTCTFIIVKCVEQIHKNRHYEEVRNDIFCALLVLPVATMVLLIGLFYADIHIQERNKLFLEIGTCMLLFANAFMFYLFHELVEMMEKASQMERLYIKSETENKYYQQVEHINEKHRALLHDIKKYIRTAVELIHRNSNSEAVQIFEKLDVEIGRTVRSHYCRNKILNAILCERELRAKEAGIQYRIHLSPELPVDHMDDIDLISVVGNLLDNALEAAEKREGDGFVSMDMFVSNEGHFMVWEISNNFLTPPVWEHGRLRTGKRDQSRHGIGIHTVERIVKSYGGRMKLEAGEQTFKALLVFQIQAPKFPS